MTRFWEIMTRFSTCWARFEDKIGRTLGRTFESRRDSSFRDTILTVFVYYLFKCFSSFLKVRENFKRGKLGKSKEVTLGLRVFD